MSVPDELAKLYNLHEKGMISFDEYQRAKEVVLSGNTVSSTNNINFESKGLNLMGHAANKWVNYSIVSAIIGAIVFILVAYFFFLPQWKKITNGEGLLRSSNHLFSAKIENSNETESIKAGWKFIYQFHDGNRWFAKDLVKLNDGTYRVFLKSIGGDIESSPFAILVDCNRQAVRDYVPGQFGSEFFKPWSPITPDSVAEIAFKSICKEN